MPEMWIVAVVFAVVAVPAGLAVFGRRGQGAAVQFTSAREEQLTRRLADAVRCSLQQALPAIQEELRIAPNQPDETLLKRAVYHYQRNQPTGGQCSAWRDASPG